MSTPEAGWRRVFDRVERAVGAPLEEAVNSPLYAGIMTTGIRTRRAITGRAGRLVGRVVGTGLRALNIPTRDDVQRIDRNLSVLAGEIRAVAAQRSQSPASEVPSTPRPVPGRSRTAAKRTVEPAPKTLDAGTDAADG